MGSPAIGQVRERRRYHFRANVSPSEEQAINTAFAAVRIATNRNRALRTLLLIFARSPEVQAAVDHYLTEHREILAA